MLIIPNIYISLWGNSCGEVEIPPKIRYDEKKLVYSLKV